MSMTETHLTPIHQRLGPCHRPLVMGILNVTPDSFSDGGRYLDQDRGVKHAREMVCHGADIIDVGPESTRPGSLPVDDAEQRRRAIPVIERIREAHPHIPISIDTRSAGVARAALSAGANIINDVSALRDDPKMAELVATSGGAVVLVHRRGSSREMQVGGGPRYDDVVAEVAALLEERAEFAESVGVARDKIILDPGIGFGKRVEDNLRLLRRLDRLVATGRPVLIGVSRKRFLGSLLGESSPESTPTPEARDAASLACALNAADRGAAILRVHDVKSTVAAIRIWRHLSPQGDPD